MCQILCYKDINNTLCDDIKTIFIIICSMYISCNQIDNKIKIFKKIREIGDDI